MRGSTQQQSWLIAFPVILLLLWTVVYPNAAVIAGTIAPRPMNAATSLDSGAS